MQTQQEQVDVYSTSVGFGIPGFDVNEDELSAHLNDVKAAIDLKALSAPTFVALVEPAAKAETARPLVFYDFADPLCDLLPAAAARTFRSAWKRRTSTRFRWKNNPRCRAIARSKRACATTCAGTPSPWSCDR